MRVPASVKQGLTLLSGTTLAQFIPAIAAPALTRLYQPADFGRFAFVLAVFGVLAPIACWRYDLAIMLPADDEEATHITVFCIAATAMVAAASLIAVSIAWHLLAGTHVQVLAPLLLLMLPVGITLLGIQLISQNWSLRTQGYRVQSLAMIAQALVTIVTQIILGVTLGSHAKFLVFGVLAGYSAAILVYLPMLREHVLPKVWKYRSRAAALLAARLYRRFPIFTGPYAFVAQTSVRGVFIVLASLTSTAVVGQYAVAQRVIVLPIVTIMSAASQIFYSRAARKLDDPRMPHMVRTALITGPLLIGPFFMMLVLYGEPLFHTVFGSQWKQAGRFAAILAIPSMIKTLTAWLDRIYDIRGRQAVSLTIESAYTVIALGATYVAVRSTRNAEFGVSVYAAATVIYYLIWMYTALSIARFDRSMGGQFLASVAAVTMVIGTGDWATVKLGAALPLRLTADLSLALAFIGAGVWIAARRLREMRNLPSDPSPIRVRA